MMYLDEKRHSLRWKTCMLVIVALVWATGNLFAQKTVSGIVKDASGNELPGVSVLLNGKSKKGTVTDVNGAFSIQASPKDELVFSYVGMVSKRVKVGNQRELQIELEDDASNLDEVVAIGYGKAKKQSLTGAVSAIRGDELLEGPSTNVSSLLGGKLPGISSVQTSGEPGDDQASLRIRGSQYGALYIVDGVERSINDVDPNDIESVSVLKDGASAAVYGLNAAGGVIIITTKKGAEGRTKISYDGQFGASVNANFPKFMNGPEYAYYYNMADMMDKLTGSTITSRDQYVPVFTKANVEAMLNGDPTDGWDNVDYIGKVFGTGFNMKHNLTVQGGTEKMHYFVSGGYQDQKGNVANFDYKRYNVRANFDSKIGKDFKFTLGAVGTVGERKTPGYASGGTDADDGYEVSWLSIGHQAIMMKPFMPEQIDGYYTSTYPNNASVAYSPLAAIYQSGYKKTHSFELNTNVSLEYEARWLKGLSAKVMGAYDRLNSTNKNLDTPYSTMLATSADGFSSYSLVGDPRGYTSNRVADGQYNTTHLTGQASISFVRMFGKHNVDAMVLGEAHDYKTTDFAAYAKDVPFSELPELSYGVASDSPISGYSGHVRTAGFVFRAKYDYNNTYLAEFSGRYDGSYNFNGNIPSKRWGFFPSLSVAWRLSHEGFMEATNSWLSDLKIRGSVGLLGNDGVPAYSFLSTYGFGNKRVINGQVVSSLYTTAVPNTELTWSKVRSQNVGLDATLWGGLLGLEFDLFYNYNYDLLSEMGGDKAPSMGGYYSSYENYSAYSNYGFEIVVSHRNKFQLAGKPFSYNVSWNMTKAASKWLKYPDSPNTQEWRKVVGTSVDAYDAWIADGLYRSEEEITNSAWYGTRPNVGDIKYVDLNGDGKIDEQDKARVARSNRPEIMMGLNLGASWNGFDFSAQFTAGLKFDVSLLGTYYNGYDDNTVWSQTFKEGANSPLWLVQNSYSLDNTDAEYPRLTLGSVSHGGDNGLASTFWMKSGNYLRLKTLQLGYSLPQKWMHALRMEKIRLFIEGSNLFTIDALPPGVDPESPRVNNGYYPQQRTYMGGVNVTF